MKQRRFIVYAIVSATIVAGSALLFFCNGDDSLKRAKMRVRIGYAVEAPYAFLDSAGNVTGESPELARIVAKRLRFQRVIWRQVEFAHLLDELQAGRIDVVAAGLFETPERMRQANFSHYTSRVREGLLVPRGNPRHIHSYKQALKLGNVRIAVLSGSVEETFLRHLEFAENQVMRVPDVLTGFSALKAGLVDGLALSSPTVNWMAAQSQLDGAESTAQFEATTDFSDSVISYGAFAFRKKDRHLLNAWNSVLKDYVGSREHLALVSKFGFSEAELTNLGGLNQTARSGK